MSDKSTEADDEEDRETEVDTVHESGSVGWRSVCRTVVVQI